MSFFSSLRDKAQSAYEGSQLAGQVNQLQAKIQGGTSATGKEDSGHEKYSQLGNITHQFRTLQMQYSSMEPVQRIITSEKGVSLDFASIAKDAKTQSKELYMWGQNETEDVKDVSDRLAYLNFVHGALSGTIASSLDVARSPFKALRDAERALQPKRQRRIALQNQIGRLEHEQQKGAETKLAELRQQLHAVEAEDFDSEKEIEIIKRKALRESEQEKWAAIREYGEKLVLLAEASTSILSSLPSIPPSDAQPYTGTQSTAAARASLQHALDNYKIGTLSHSFQPSAADLERSDSRSFGVTHASELSHIGASDGTATPPASSTEHPTFQSSGQASAPVRPLSPLNPAALNHSPAPVSVQTPLAQPERIASPPSAHSATSPSQASIPLQPSALHLNNTPTPIPTKQHSVHSAEPLRIGSPTSGYPMPIAIPEPTIAETGVPLTGTGAEGPGPASGSLKDLHSPSNSAAKTTADYIMPDYGVSASVPPQKVPNAEEEKAKLAQEERERLLRDQTSGQKFESAAEEKNRLEREEKERLLREGDAGPGVAGSSQKKDGDDGTAPPAYQDY